MRDRIICFLFFVTGIIFCILNDCPAYAGMPQSQQELLYRQIQNKIQTGNISAAIGQAREAVEQYPNSWLLNQLLGMALYTDGLKTEAAAAFSKAIQINPRVSANYFDLGLIELSLRDPSAVKDLETFVRLEPHSAQGHLLLGHAYQYLNLTLPAIEQYKIAIQLSPQLPLGHYHLGLAYQSQGDLGSALAQFKREIEINPNFPDSYWLAGDIELDQGNLNAAETLFQNCLRLKPNVFQAHYGMARLLLAEGRLKDAESELEKCVTMNPSSIKAHYTLAQTYQRLGRKDDAKREYQITIRLHTERHAHLSSGIAKHQP